MIAAKNGRKAYPPVQKYIEYTYRARRLILMKMPLLPEVVTPSPFGVLLHDQKRQIRHLKY